MTGLAGIQLLAEHRSGRPSCGLYWPPGPSPWTGLLTPALSLQDLLWGQEPGRRVLLAPSLEAWSGGFLKNCFTKSFIINKFPPSSSDPSTAVAERNSAPPKVKIFSFCTSWILQAQLTLTEPAGVQDSVHIAHDAPIQHRHHMVRHNLVAAVLVFQIGFSELLSYILIFDHTWKKATFDKFFWKPISIFCGRLNPAAELPEYISSLTQPGPLQYFRSISCLCRNSSRWDTSELCKWNF